MPRYASPLCYFASLSIFTLACIATILLRAAMLYFAADDAFAAMPLLIFSFRRFF